MLRSEFGPFREVFPTRGSSLGQLRSEQLVVSKQAALCFLILHAAAVGSAHNERDLGATGISETPRSEQEEAGRAGSRKDVIGQDLPAMWLGVWRGLHVGRKPSPAWDSLLWAQRPQVDISHTPSLPRFGWSCAQRSSSLICMYVLLCILAVPGGLALKLPGTADTQKQKLLALL